MFTFLQPFTASLWLALLTQLLCYGVGIWYLEKDSRRSEDYIGSVTLVGAVASSVYYAFALFTGSGGHTPMTKGGRLLSLTLGFSILVAVAAYTVRDK